MKAFSLSFERTVHKFNESELEYRIALELTEVAYETRDPNCFLTLIDAYISYVKSSFHTLPLEELKFKALAEDIWRIGEEFRNNYSLKEFHAKNPPRDNGYYDRNTIWFLEYYADAILETLGFELTEEVMLDNHYRMELMFRLFSYPMRWPEGHYKL